MSSDILRVNANLTLNLSQLKVDLLICENFTRKKFELFNDNSKIKTFCFRITVKQRSFFRVKSFADR